MAKNTNASSKTKNTTKKEKAPRDPAKANLSAEQTHFVCRLANDAAKLNQELYTLDVAAQAAGIDEKAAKRIVRQLETRGFVTTSAEARLKTVKSGKSTRQVAKLVTYVRLAPPAIARYNEIMTLLNSLQS